MRVARKLAAVVMLTVSLVACGRQDNSLPPPPPKPVTNAPALATTHLAPVPKPEPPPPPVLSPTIAQVRGDNEVPVVAKVSGYLVQQKWKWHDMIIHAGDVLFLIDSRQMHNDSSDASPKDLIPIVAPVAGILESVRHGPGDYVQHDEVLATMATIDQVEAEFSLAIDAHTDLVARFEQIAALPPGARMADIELLPSDGSAYDKWGTIASTRREGRNCIVVVRFPNPGHVLKPGEFVTLRGAAMPVTSEPAPPPSR